MRKLIGWFLFFLGLCLVSVGRITFLAGDTVVDLGGKVWLLGCEKLGVE